jgi:carbon monoxide dehydrogenase subunit G
VRIGPIAMTYRGDVQITERDEAARTAVMHAKTREACGQGTADAHVHLSLAAEQGGTRAALATDVALSGRVAATEQG